jgi:YesN/AraC family two-component response regulator
LDIFFPTSRCLKLSEGHEAFKVVENQKVDVVISDINMPNGDGFWLLEKLTTHYHHIPVIIVRQHSL